MSDEATAYINRKIGDWGCQKEIRSSESVSSEPEYEASGLTVTIHWALSTINMKLSTWHWSLTKRL